MIFLVFLCVFQIAICANYYVSTNGSDTGPGTLKQPFKTFARAQLSLQSHPKEDNTVFVFPGTFTEPITFTYKDSGQNGFSNTYQALDGSDKPIISGGKTIEGSQFQYDATTKAYKVYVGSGVKTRQLYVNNRRATRAVSGLPMNTKLTETGYQLPSDYATIWYKYSAKSAIEFVENKHWVQLRCLVEDISETGAITMQNPCWKWVSQRHGGATQFDYPTYVENNIAFLGQPDEWYLDSESGYLYYIPLTSEPIEKSIFHLPVQERLVYADGNVTNPITGITLNGFVFRSSTWMGPNENGEGFAEVQANVCSDGKSPIGAIEVQYGRNIVIENSILTQIGGMGILLGTGTQDCKVSGNQISDVSSVAIKIGDQNGNRPNVGDQTRNNMVYNNLIRYPGQEFHGAPAVMIGFCWNCTVSHNDISFTPYTGISHSWGWASVIGNFEGSNTISNNLVNNTMMSLFDGGDFYTLGTQDKARSTCKENVFVGSHNCYGSLYLDDGSRYWDVYDNLVFGNVMSALIKGGEHNIHDNWWQNRGKIKACGTEDIMFEHNTDYCAPCSSNPCVQGKCSPCGPNVVKNNHEITSLSQAPKSILDNAGLVK